MIKVNEVVAKLFELQKVQVREQISDQTNRYLENLKVLEGHPLQCKISKEYWDNEYRYGMVNPLLRKVYSRCFVASGNDYSGKPHECYTSGNQYETPLKIRENFKEILEEVIDSELEIIMGNFLRKMEHKLLGVIKTKQITEFETKGWINGFVSLKFDNGSSFNLSNSIENGQSKYNVPFQKYPTRYHDVKFADGSSMKSPSELKMKAEF